MEKLSGRLLYFPLLYIIYYIYISALSLPSFIVFFHGLPSPTPPILLPPLFPLPLPNPFGQFWRHVPTWSSPSLLGLLFTFSVTRDDDEFHVLIHCRGCSICSEKKALRPQQRTPELGSHPCQPMHLVSRHLQQLQYCHPIVGILNLSWSSSSSIEMYLSSSIYIEGKILSNGEQGLGKCRHLGRTGFWASPTPQSSIPVRLHIIRAFSHVLRCVN